MSRVEEIRELYEYDRWANRRILNATSLLSEGEFTRGLGSSFPSVRDTLVHILAAAWVWLARWEGMSPKAMPDGWRTSTHDELRTRWEEMEHRLEGFLDHLTEARLDEPVSYRTTGGEAFRTPLGQMLRHVVNHSTFHRGQVVTMLRQLGAEAVPTDLILFYRTKGQEAGAGGARTEGPP